MKPAYRMILLSTFLSFPLLCFAISPDPPPGKINQFKTAIAQDKTGAQFDYSAKVTKSIGKSVITFTPATLQTGASLKVLENGFLLGDGLRIVPVILIRSSRKVSPLARIRSGLHVQVRHGQYSQLPQMARSSSRLPTFGSI